MERRHFLQLLGILSLEPRLFGCQGPRDPLRIKLLRGTFPSLSIGEFRRFSKSDQLKVTIFDQLADGLQLLNKWIEPPPKPNFWNWQQWRFPWQAPPDHTPANLLSIGDTWLHKAIDQNLLQPLAISELPSWQKLPEKWQQIGSRDGKIWGAPYRWGSTVLVYRRDRLAQNQIPLPTDWQDLWQPALKGKVVLLNQQQEIIGLTLKRLGHSYHTDPQEVPKLLPELKKLHQQALFYSSDRYISPLLTGDAWVAVGWSSDVMGLLKHQPELGIAIPTSGTSLWADLWVQSRSAIAAPKAPSIQQWIDFGWQESVARKIVTITHAASPVFNDQNLPPELRDYQLLKPEVLAKGEFLPSLNSAQQQQYEKLWQEMRT
jgi:putative spermidine/putrescine transport system substrate-binding protein